MRSRRPALAITAALAVIAPCASDTALADTTVECAERKPTDPPRTVVEILDADTLRLDDGSEVRLIGALAPNRPLTFTSRAAWLPEQQAVAGLTEIALGKSVELIAAGRPVDRYGRGLAQVVVIGSGGARVWLQGALLDRGLARAYALPGSTDCLGEMLAREGAARAARLGLWSHGAYAVRRASRPSDLMKARSTYQIVEGRVTSVAFVRGAIYLNFGADWRRDFTAGLLRREKARDSEVAKLDVATLKGKTVRVRGWIERRNGPFIELVDRAQIEIVNEPANAAPLAANAASPIGTAGGENKKRPASLPGALEP